MASRSFCGILYPALRLRKSDEEGRYSWFCICPQLAVSYFTGFQASLIYITFQLVRCIERGWSAANAHETIEKQCNLQHFLAMKNVQPNLARECQ